MVIVIYLILYYIVTSTALWPQILYPWSLPKISVVREFPLFYVCFLDEVNVPYVIDLCYRNKSESSILNAPSIF